jgi:hypothetical protein
VKRPYVGPLRSEVTRSTGDQSFDGKEARTIDSSTIRLFTESEGGEEMASGSAYSQREIAGRIHPFVKVQVRVLLGTTLDSIFPRVTALNR